MLRGVNLGAHRRISMEPLRAMFESLGLKEVRTYVQSGNIVFRTAAKDTRKLATRIAKQFESVFGFHSDIILRLAPEIRELIARNPFRGRSIDPAKLLVWFLEKDPPPDAQKKIQALPIAPEEIQFAPRELYIHFPNGQGRSKLPWPQLERALGCSGTGRNWNTVLKLAEMAESLPE